MARELLIDFSLTFTKDVTISVRRLSLDITESQVIVLFGPSGSGKSTILRVLAGLTRPDSGKISFCGKTWFDRTTHLPPQQRNIGLVSQDYALFPHLTIAQNISYGMAGQNAATRQARVREFLSRFDLSSLAERLPAEISGGQQQRVALARAMIRMPDLLLLDEPLSALDAPTRKKVCRDLHAFLKASGIPSLVVTHESSEALALADQMVLVHEGKILQSGPPNEVYNHPVNLAAAKILEVDSIVQGTVNGESDGLATISANGTLLYAFVQDPIPSGSQVIVCIRAEDVTLSPPGSHRDSARNHLPATIISRTDDAGLVRIEMDCGFLLRAVLTRQSTSELDIRVGQSLCASIKAPNVHVIPKPADHPPFPFLSDSAK